MINETHIAKIGLSPKEAKIYFALLENGPLFLQQISKESGIKRTTLYSIIEKMINEDVVGVEVKQKRKKYFAKNPENLLWQLREQGNFLEAIMPQLQTLFAKQTAGTRIQVYDTVGGLQKTLEEIINLDPKKDEIISIEGDVRRAINIGFDFWKELLTKKKKLGIPSRTIVPSDEKDEFIIREHNIQIRTSSFLKDFKIMLYLFSNKALIIIPSETLTIVIENKKIKDSLVNIFEILWRRAKPWWKYKG